MPVLLLGQFLTGAGGGGLYAMSVGTVAKTYPDHMRARVLALMASMWILPGPPRSAARGADRQHGRLAVGLPDAVPGARGRVDPAGTGPRPRADGRRRRRAHLRAVAAGS